MPAAPWSVPSEPFSFARRPNSRPDVDEHTVGEPARLEVALEGEQRVGGQLQALRERLRLVGVGVVRRRAPRSATTRIGSPAASIAASARSRFGNASFAVG